MTHAERAVIESVTATPILWSPLDDSRFVAMQGAGTCPLLTTQDGQASCSVYEVRPYNCRRFGCFRPDPATEPLEPGGPMGCYNASDRAEQSLTVYTTRL
jgi:hypothetical protein